MMGEIAGSIWWLIVVLGLLVTFHEFGHFWVARRLGVRVLRFSVGFGKPLLSRRMADGTEFVIAALPLGGYVKMLDEREGAVPPEQLDQAFNRKSLSARSAIVAAGPVFNLIFALFAFWLMFMVGTQEQRPIIGAVEGLAAESGIPAGSLITRVDDESAATWTHVILGLMGPALDREQVTLHLQQQHGEGETVVRKINFARLERPVDERDLLASIGIIPWRFSMELPAVIGQVAGDGAAAEAGMQPGDRIIAINGREVDSWYRLTRVIDQQAVAGEPLKVLVQRDSRRLELAIQPRPAADSGRLLLGIGAQQPDEATIAEWQSYYFNWRYGPLAAIPAAAGELWRLTTGTLGILGRMITGKASVQNLSGPITIARLANESAGLGLSRFLFFLGLLSLSLAILNLLPIPMLDGGHLLYYAIEAVTGKPVSEQVQVVGQGIGILLLVGLMSLAFANDILRLLG